MNTTCLINEEGRECSKCNQFKIWDCFAKNRQSDIGYSSSCKACNYKDKQVSESKKYNLTICNRSKHPEVKKELMTGRHPEPPKGNYWEDTKKFWKIVTIWYNPHLFVLTKIK